MRVPPIIRTVTEGATRAPSSRVPAYANARVPTHMTTAYALGLYHCHKVTLAGNLTIFVHTLKMCGVNVTRVVTVVALCPTTFEGNVITSSGGRPELRSAASRAIGDQRPHASISATRDHVRSAVPFTTTLMRSVVYGAAKVTVRLTRLLPVTLASVTHVEPFQP